MRISTSFNSQRDGILPGSLPLRKFKEEVSIPNGMEFYYTLTTDEDDAYWSFNSQRDGILLSVSTDKSDIA